MSAECNACYIASTQPYWMALWVTKLRTDKPCEKHKEEA